MLEQVSKQDKKWRGLALKLTGCKQEADDLVQDVYIKLYELSLKYPNKEVKDGYVYSAIVHLFYDKQKQKKKLYNIDDYVIKEEVNKYELSDEDLKLIERASQLDRAYFKIYLEKSYDNSLRQIAEELDTDYGFIFRALKKVRKHVLKDDYDKLYNNKRNKHL